MAEPKEVELTDSQLLDIARQLEHELKFKQNAATGLRQYVGLKQKKKSLEQDVADLGKKIEEQKRLLTLAFEANTRKITELDNEFAMKRAAKEKEFEDFGARLGKEIDGLKEAVAAQESAKAHAEKENAETIKRLDAEQRKKMAAHSKAEKEKIARNEALDEEHRALQQAIDELKKKHGLK